MTFFVKPTVAPSPKNKLSGLVAIAYAAVLVILAVAQLFSFEDMPSIVASFWLPGGSSFAQFLAAFIVVAEVFSLPFLLRMNLSPAMRWLAMVLSWIVAGFWLFVGVWLNTTVNAVSNSGLLGAKVELAPGGWVIGVGVVLVGLAVWSSWGLWSTKRHR